MSWSPYHQQEPHEQLFVDDGVLDIVKHEVFSDTEETEEDNTGEKDSEVCSYEGDCSALTTPHITNDQHSDTRETSDGSSTSSDLEQTLEYGFPVRVDVLPPHREIKRNYMCKFEGNKVILKKGAFFNLHFHGNFDDISVRAYIGYSRPPRLPIRSCQDDWLAHLDKCDLHQSDHGTNEADRKFLCSDIPNFLSDKLSAAYRPISQLKLNTFSKNRSQNKSGYVTLTAICYNSCKLHKNHGSSSTLFVDIKYKPGLVGGTLMSFAFEIWCRSFRHLPQSPAMSDSIMVEPSIPPTLTQSPTIRPSTPPRSTIDWHADANNQESSTSSDLEQFLENEFPVRVDIFNPPSPLKMSSMVKFVGNKVSLKKGAFFRLRFHGNFEDISVRSHIGYSHSRPPRLKIRSCQDDWLAHLNKCDLHQSDRGTDEADRKFLCSDIPNFLSDTPSADYRPINQLKLSTLSENRSQSGYVTLMGICYNSCRLHKSNGSSTTLYVDIKYKAGQLGERHKLFEFIIACRGSPCRDFPSRGRSRINEIERPSQKRKIQRSETLYTNNNKKHSNRCSPSLSITDIVNPNLEEVINESPEPADFYIIKGNHCDSNDNVSGVLGSIMQRTRNEISTNQFSDGLEPPANSSVESYMVTIGKISDRGVLQNIVENLRSLNVNFVVSKVDPKYSSNQGVESIMGEPDTVTIL